MTAILFSSNSRRSLAFYKDVLGFSVDQEEDGLRVRLADLELKVFPTDDPVLTSNVGVVFHFEGVRDLHKRLRKRDLRVRGIQNEDASGQMRFFVRDPDGNTLHFVEKIVAAKPGVRDLKNQHKESIQ